MRHALVIDDTLLFAFGGGAADRLDQFRHPQRESDRLALPQRRRQRAGAIIERQHPAVAVQRDDGIRQTGNERAQQSSPRCGDRRPAAPSAIVIRTGRTAKIAAAATTAKPATA